uniref:RNA-directed DNA polymerase, eukaryota n=1 Tax=Tanacetum cinerariifolium TaxID=118510 RepID=A0A6L2N1U6_TANCI|nr:RNA-directed DNA polymerase, eukaryota [Tanacetum cinerariifolium]
MGSYRSKEDEVLKISTSVFVANFPDSFGAKDLWNTCNNMGMSLMPIFLIEDRKQVLDVDRLVNNLCTVWVGRHKLQANISRFQREPLKRHSSLHNIDGVKGGNSGDTYNSNGMKGAANSYAHVVKGSQNSKMDSDSSPMMIPDFVEDNDEEEDSDVGSYEEVPNGEDVKNVEDLEGDSDGEIVLDTKFEEDFPNQKGEEDLVGQGGSILQLIDDLVKVGETLGASVGNSGGILCVWDPKMFKKTNSTVSDYFVTVRGDWMPNDKKPLIISVYAPQELYEKKMLWDYLSLVMSNWEGDVVIMGDFNEVRNKSERFGTLFNRHGVDVFNRFISNAGLEEVSLEGCSLTWCHRSATKMSKLDRFLISDSLLCSCPNISSSTLDRYLSDHRPILMRKVYYNYGPVPFRFFHYCFEVDGFDKFIKDSRKDALIIESNDLVRMMKKLKYLKEKIRMWNKLNKEKSHKSKKSLLEELADCDAIIDKGEGENNVVNRITEVVNLLQEVEKKNSLEAAQKAKINSVEVADLECQVSKEEIKKAVWDCGIDKSPSPNGFTFGFYRRYWKLIENDVVDVVTCFFHQDSFPKGNNSSFIILIPKTPNANMVKDYMPISLIESMYKIISKILENRLVVDDKVKHADVKIGCNTLKTLFSYLGSKVVGCMSHTQSWNETIERMTCRLSKWKLKTLSIGGRLTLLKSVLGSMPIYHMSLFKVQKKVLHRMESMRSYFFNGAELSSKKSVWVKWKHALASKDKGSLGVSSLFALNRALIFKWVWHFITQGSSLWARVIKALHGYDGKIGQKVKSCYPSLWLDIINEVVMFKSRGIDLVSLIHSKLGLDVSFRRPPSGGVELQQFEHMKEKVEGCILADMMDRWFWALEGSGEFTITSVRKMIDDFMLPEVSSKKRVGLKRFLLR